MHLITSKKFLAICIACIGIVWYPLAAAAVIVLPGTALEQPLGKYAGYMQEADTPLTIEQAIAASAANKFSAGTNTILTFGIGSRPVWIHLSVFNPGSELYVRRLRIENSWLDHLQVYFVQDNQVINKYDVGDRQPFSHRPLSGRYFSFEHDFGMGTTDIYLRVETPDPMVVPVFLLSQKAAAQRNEAEGYSYGFVYGYLIALLAYNILLYLALRQKRHLLYAVFMATFVAMNIAYTGHGFAWIWSEHEIWQNWVIPIFMVCFGVSGLSFARNFLDTRASFPRTHQVVTAIRNLFVVLLLTAIAVNSQLYALLVAFAFVIFFSCAMLVLGLMALYSGHQFARYFLLASIASMVGTTITTLSVWGLVSFADWKFRAVEIGMLVDATLLALALANQFRSIQVEHMRAEQRAARDPLTNLNNRRAFLENALPIWSTSRRNGRDLSVIMLDLDHFKSINDQYGHAAGDLALVATAKVLASSAREGDIVARWGGEEFLFLLPETRLEAANALAERLQKAILCIRVPVGNAEISLTASFGVADSTNQDSLESLISKADACLYQSKKNGRNRISC
ncbi:MAG: diguanylate cyclase [Sideroxydans sp.]|nr:diguanylate cyclase [Sideroxydans sp.]